MVELYKSINEAYESGQKQLIRLKDEKFDFEKIVFSLYLSFESSAWYNCLQRKNINAAKQDFYNCGIANISQTEEGVDIFSYNRNSPLNAAFSDSKELINSFADIEYTLRSGPLRGKTNKEIARTGKSHIYIDTIIKSMNKDYDGLNSNLKLMQSIFLKFKKNQVFKTDFDFFDGISNDNKDKVFKSINRLATLEHKKRNKNSYYMKDLISQPAAGYAKIAWINGLELEFENQLIPNELLPIKPLINYENKIQEYKLLMND